MSGTSIRIGSSEPLWSDFRKPHEKLRGTVKGSDSELKYFGYGGIYTNSRTPGAGKVWSFSYLKLCTTPHWGADVEKVLVGSILMWRRQSARRFWELIDVIGALSSSTYYCYMLSVVKYFV